MLWEEVARLPVGNEQYQKLLDLLAHRYRVLPFMGYRPSPPPDKMTPPPFVRAAWTFAKRYVIRARGYVRQLA